jgi:hypothetical protein
MTTIAADRPRLALSVPAVGAYAAATGLVSLHLLAAAVLEGRSALVALTVAVALAAAFRRLRPSVQAWTAFVVGALAVADAALHVAHARRGGSPFAGPPVRAPRSARA